MRRDQLEHILRAAAEIVNERDFIIIDSQALLGAFPELGAPFDQSMELDLYPANNPELAALIDGTIGELSPFDETFGVYAHGVAEETAVLPSDWRNRLIVVENVNTGRARGFCLHPVDVAVSKLVAGRPKDIDFVRAMFDAGLVDRAAVASVLADLAPEISERIHAWLAR
jgi:hypothetical protein